jgi:hypothetical protein
MKATTDFVSGENSLSASKRCLFGHPHMVEEANKPLQMSYARALIAFMRAKSS